jgi:hypothetical protein
MFKGATIAVSILLFWSITFLAVPTAFCFEDYIFVETPVEEESATNELYEMGGGGSPSYEEIQDDAETLKEEATLEQDEELQETEQPLYEEEQQEIR